MMYHFIPMADIMKADRTWDEIHLKKDIYELLYEIEETSEEMSYTVTEEEKSKKFLAELTREDREYLMVEERATSDWVITELYGKLLEKKQREEAAYNVGQQGSKGKTSRSRTTTTRTPRWSRTATDKAQEPKKETQASGSRDQTGQRTLAQRIAPRTDSNQKESTTKIQDRPESRLCYNCGQLGHLKADCPMRKKKVNAIRRGHASDADQSASAGSESEATMEGDEREEGPTTVSTFTHYEADRGELERYLNPNEERDSGEETERRSQLEKSFAPLRIVPMDPEEVKALKTMQPSSTAATKGSATDGNPHFPRMRPAMESTRQPKRDEAAERPCTLYVTINGIAAYALADPGAEIDAMSPEFAAIANITPIKLDDPMKLQMGLRNNKGSVMGGAWANMKIADTLKVKDHYFDIAPLDRYDIIIGTPLLNKTKLDVSIWRKCLYNSDLIIECFTKEQDADVNRTRPTMVRARERRARENEKQLRAMRT